ncbi:MAG: hypothetical protein ACRDJW_00090 [Thermomicrobiales bacterium]
MSTSRPQPMAISVNPKLDFALRLGWENWERAASRLGEEDRAAWLHARLKDRNLAAAAAGLLSALFEEEDAEERAVHRAELAELIELTDDELADTLWEGVLAFGREANDSDYLFEATQHLGAIAERYGDPLAAAEYFIDFLNWRRDGDHASDAEPIEVAFEEITRLAEVDGEPKSAAIFTYRQANYHRLVEAEDDRTTAGDWEPDPTPYQSWS